jgi:hypothetical protein
MENATIGDGSGILYELDWGDHSRTTDEIGDLAEAGFDVTMDDIVEVAKEDPDCEVSIIGFEQ